MKHKEWLEWRQKGIGSSDAPVIMGVSPWKTLLELYKEKIGPIVEKEDNWAMAYGREMEEPARLQYEIMKDTCVRPKNRVHHEIEWLRASYDGLDIDEKIAVEIKNPNEQDHLCAIKGKVPEKYYPQVQHLIKVKELDGMDYFSMWKGQGIIVRVERDDNFIWDYLLKAEEFWNRVLAGDPPPACERDIPIIDTKAWRDLCWQKQVICNDIKQQEEKLAKVKMLMINEANGKSAKGAGVYLYKSECQGRIDMEALQKDFPDIDMDKYRKKSYEKWTMRDI